MARIEFVEQRLNLWAEWVHRGRSGLGGGMLAMFNGEAIDSGPPTARIPLNEEECWNTEASVLKLEQPLQDTVVLYYLSGTLAVRSKLDISDAVLSKRLDKAHRVLSALWLVAGPVEDQLPRSFTPLS
ncbi:MAG: hypothetical protein EPO09_04935 [Aquabacterium sp.]|uniref:hypothetical protein n=1 Tax=Aquabacterium sp. TaxID=1872578 RepID=UPI0011F7EEB4|nr:hypothetical protein [Aquabacterium sp.]TAK97056.1 MAG: hypothetical protein EPO09_04935 [Aquabacterium sp.]